LNTEHGLITFLKVETRLLFDLEVGGNEEGIDLLSLEVILGLLVFEVVVDLLKLDAFKTWFNLAFCLGLIES
jgi:hypothetical protein